MKTPFFKFKPQYVEKIWGGRKLQTELHKDLPKEVKVGESWEVSGLKNMLSVCSEGNEKGKTFDALIQLYGSRLLGKKATPSLGSEFPLLIKFIDAQETLSLQVHPDDAVARKKGYKNGKNEFWYILDSEKEGFIYYGFREDIKEDSFRKAILENRVEELLNKVYVNSGDYFFVPAGTIHAIGKGVLLAEVQQPSDITYRVYDYSRTDVNGKLRDLHIEDAIESLNFNKTAPNEKANGENNILVENQYFRVRKFQLTEKLCVNYQDTNSFVVILCIEGEVKLDSKNSSTTLYKGETLLISADVNRVNFESEVKAVFLEITL